MSTIGWWHSDVSSSFFIGATVIPDECQRCEIKVSLSSSNAFFSPYDYIGLSCFQFNKTSQEPVFGGAGIAAFAQINADGQLLTSSFLGHYKITKIANSLQTDSFANRF